MKTILIVEDDPQLCEMLALMLTKEGFETKTASDGEAGVRACERQNFDLILTDVLMPQKDGIEMILTLRQRGCRSEVIAMSGGRRAISSHFALQSAQLMGVSRVLAKPFSRQELLAAVHSVLG